jgi:hypothetical protein
MQTLASSSPQMIAIAPPDEETGEQFFVEI